MYNSNHVTILRNWALVFFGNNNLYIAPQLWCKTLVIQLMVLFLWWSYCVHCPNKYYLLATYISFLRYFTLSEYYFNIHC